MAKKPAKKAARIDSLGELLSFTALLNKFSSIERVILIKNRRTRENDSEHSFQLAITAWYLINKDKLKLDTELAIKYALVHDLVEAYAGDTPFFERSSTKHIHSTKEQREKKAAERLKKEFPRFPELHSLITSYEKRKDPESNFVYALDKILPMMNIYLDGGRIWKQYEVTFDELVLAKTKKVVGSKEIKEYFEKFVSLLQKNSKKVFN
jgi:putative hydrolase of HD superfamily